MIFPRQAPRVRRVHVVGAGLAGLATSLRLAESGVGVVLHEAARQAGGRCRSYRDATLGCRIDNGNHLLLAGNHAAMDYLRRIGAADTLIGPDPAVFPFLDLASGERWTLRPNAGRFPWWLFQSERRVAGTRPRDYLAGLRLFGAGPDAVVTDRLDPRSLLFRRFWQPLAVAALNTEAEQGAASLLGRVLRESFGAGGAASRPLVPRDGLSESLVEPALDRLHALGAELRFGSRLRAIEFAGERAALLGFDDGGESLAADEAVVLAVTAPVAARLVPDLIVPDDFRAIVNAHYRIAAPAAASLFVGLVGGTSEWVFRKSEVLSVTISAADRLVDTPAEELAQRLWPEVCRAYELGEAALPAWQIVKERRATFAATPAQQRRRPPAATRWRNLVLAGDFTATRLPATIEGAVRSGDAAAARLLAETA
ncbi:MAG TPA: hydroxysqualene dehydroxylase HpnE [Stellaceae bacterium]|nr:hydroxysqualene dehydroxylase HpnE [Stellaceae bacterium]